MIRFALIILALFCLSPATSLASGSKKKAHHKHVIDFSDSSGSSELNQGVSLSAEEASEEDARSRADSRMLANIHEPLPGMDNNVSDAAIDTEAPEVIENQMGVSAGEIGSAR